jgi:hypothetical protein
VSSKLYMQGRKSFLRGGSRPQGLLWSNNPGTLQDGFYVPTGTEGEDFIIISDHNRSEISISQQRIETRQRMINGNMRSYWIADKVNISSSWSRLPSRPFNKDVFFNEFGVPSQADYVSYTVDGAAGGADMLNWYENNKGSFFLFLSYDKYNIGGNKYYDRLNTYTQRIKVYFSAFDYSVEKRSGIGENGGFDFWNISVSMEEA